MLLALPCDQFILRQAADAMFVYASQLYPRDALQVISINGGYGGCGGLTQRDVEGTYGIFSALACCRPGKPGERSTASKEAVSSMQRVG